MPIGQKKKRKTVAGHKKLTVTRAAQLLAVERTHLSKVLHGHRTSHSLTRRYQQLLAQHTNA